MINSDDLRFFRVVASSASLSAAARTLDITPPSVTQRLQSIEARLGIKLIHRPSRQVKLTDEGEILLQKTQTILSEIDALHDVIDIKKENVNGILRVLAPLGFGSEYIAPLLADFGNQHPDLSIDLTLSDDPNWMNADKWDVVIYIGHLKDTSLYCIKIAANRRILCASPEYLSRCGYPANPDDLKNHNCLVLRENNEDVTRWKFSKGKEDISIRIKPKLSSNDGRTIKGWALKGMGIMVRSEWDIRGDLRSGRLLPILEEYSLPSADIVALTGLREINRPPRLQKFLEMIKGKFQHAPWNS